MRQGTRIVPDKPLYAMLGSMDQQIAALLDIYGAMGFMGRVEGALIDFDLPSGSRRARAAYERLMDYLACAVGAAVDLDDALEADEIDS